MKTIPGETCQRRDKDALKKDTNLVRQLRIGVWVILRRRRGSGATCAGEKLVWGEWRWLEAMGRHDWWGMHEGRERGKIHDFNSKIVQWGGGKKGLGEIPGGGDRFITIRRLYRGAEFLEMMGWRTLTWSSSGT